MKMYPLYTPPDVLVLLWNAFTALSIIFVAVTARSTLAIAFKTLHVAVEASFLVSILWLTQMRALSALAAVAVFTILCVVLLYPCEVSIGWAEVGGLVLDSVNFVMHWAVLCRQPTNLDLRSTTQGFGLHAIYLLLYLVVNDMHRFVPLELSTNVRATLRVLSMLMNLAAIQVFLSLERRRLLAPSGRMTVGEWNATCAGTGRALWTSSRSVVLGDDSGELVALHRPLETAYADDVVAPRFAMGETARVVDGEVVVHTWTGQRRLEASDPPASDAIVRVHSVGWRDAWVFWGSVVAGFVLWAL